MEKLIEQIKLKAANCGDATKEERARKGAYVDCLVMMKEALHKHDVSSRLSIEKLIWQKQNPDEPFNADDFYDWAAENSKQALDFAFDIYRELGR